VGGGILFGIGSAACFSVSYLFSRRFVSRFSGGAASLLTISHIIMLAFSAAILPFCWPRAMPTFGEYAGPLCGSAFYYLAGQAALFLALKRSDASRVSPLLGLKILMLVAISVTFLGKRYSAPQWFAVLLTFCAAAMLSQAGGRLAWKSLGWILLACLGYSLSDLSMQKLLIPFETLGLFHASMVSNCLCHILCGLVGVLALCVVRPLSAGMCKVALPYAVSWFGAMLFLFACFGSVGVVYGNIVQSTRGVISIMLGWLVAKAGLEHLEKRISFAVLVRRALAALLMAAAIALFHLGAR